MNVLFLTLLGFDSLQERNIYTDLLREFVKNGHHVYALSPVEKRQNRETYVIKEENATILRLQIGNTQKTNILEKGISTLLIEPQFKSGIKKYFSNVKFDLLLYSTPPITLVGAIEYVKKRDGAKSYLLLKDIFPQNAVDIGMMSKKGLKGLLYNHFRKQEKKLYAISDRIGCMSQANVDYLLMHNPNIDPKIVEVCPNCVDVIDKSVDEETRKGIRKKYDIPLDKKIFVYGGNLGKPQGIPFLIECLKQCDKMENVFFLLVGDGTEYKLLSDYVGTEKSRSVKLLKRLPKEDYDILVGACDVGLIFLDFRFTIPNFPSRLLTYMQAKIPVLAATDEATDLGKVIVDNHFGKWCPSNNSDIFFETINCFMNDMSSFSAIEEFEFLQKYYNSNVAYRIIVNSFRR